MNTKISFRSLMLTLFAALALVTIKVMGGDVRAQVSACDSAADVEGEYRCAGECVVAGADGKMQVVSVSGETDRIRRFPEAREQLYEINIEGEGGFHEIEIGALVGLTLRTATVKVSDAKFPVLEEYLFNVGPACKAQGFTKIVRNPSADSFKSCVINCGKKSL